MSVPIPDETILGLLAAQAQHGYQLLDTFTDPAKLGNVWKLSTSQLYAVLKRLERFGLIAGSERASDSAPTRVEYHLTHAGWTALQAWLYEAHPSPSIRRIRVEFLSRLYVAQLLEIDALALIERQRAICEAELDRLCHQPRVENVSGLAADFVIAQLEAVLAWIERCASVLHPPRLGS